MTFPDAFDRWLARRSLTTPAMSKQTGYLEPKTMQDYRTCALALAKFFGQLRLGDIHAGHLMEYQSARAVCDRGVAEWARPAGANCIRKEIALLIRILKAAKLWTDEQAMYFEPLRAVESDVPRAMTPEEQHRFLHTASSREEWQFVYWYSILALQTTAGCKELRMLRLGDVLLSDAAIQIRRASAKNKYRIRTIPLVTPDALWAMERLMDRARSLGSHAPHHYLFPVKCAYQSYDPDKSMTEWGMRKRFEAVRVAAQLPHLRIYDLRHTAITRMAEAGTPIQVIMSMAGHMTMRMQQHYTTISLSAKRSWVAAAWGAPGAGPASRKGVASVGVAAAENRAG